MAEEHDDIWNEDDRTLAKKRAGDRDTDPEEFFSAGLFLYQRNRLKEAMKAFGRALELRGTEPRYMSYYGLCLARVGGRLKEGLALCERAAQKEFYRAELFHNLAQVYTQAGNKKRAYESLRKGMALDRHNRDIVRELERMGIRKPPVFPFLERRNAVNKIAGKILYRLRLRR